MTDPGSAERVSPLVRAGIRVGRVLGIWRRRLSARKADRFVAAWKREWGNGSDAARRGADKDTVPHRRGSARDAWLAGWHWTRNESARGVGPDNVSGSSATSATDRDDV